MQRTPASGGEAAEQTFPIEAVHGLFPEQATIILVVVPLMSIADSELMIVIELASGLMKRSLPW